MENNKNSESEYIIIPNPIYDVVFRYLMEDNESAIIILSTLINEKIIKLNFEPLTHTEKKKELDFDYEPDVKLFHLDFTATVELPDGTDEIIMIELQKASEPDDIFRFKRYISKNFQRKQKKEIINPKTQSIQQIDKPVRLIPIFILNFRIENEVNDLLIKTNHIKTGVFKNKELTKHNEFIDNLIYDIWVVQLPNLHKINEDEYINDEYKSKLYALLQMFDQKSRVRSNEHRLRIMKKLLPGFLERVIKRLQAASINNPGLEEEMFVEDEYLKALLRKDNETAFFKENLEKEKKLGKEKDNIIYNLAKMLKENNVSDDIILQKTNLTQEEIDNL